MRGGVLSATTTATTTTTIFGWLRGIVVPLWFL